MLTRALQMEVRDGEAPPLVDAAVEKMGTEAFDWSRTGYIDECLHTW